LAAAIQDYKRGVIIGSKQTYGKGLFKTLIDLNQFVRNNEVGDLGALKLPQKIYRINGGSTQLEGVSSDVVMRSLCLFKMGERDVENAMPWDKIDAADYYGLGKQLTLNKTIMRIVEAEFKIMHNLN
jgi:carboxyl-terminal processing protease